MQALLRAWLPVIVIVLAGLPLAAGSVPIGKAEDVGMSTERLKRIGEAVQRHITAGDVAGAVTLVARRGKIAHFEAQGVMDVDTKKPMAKDNLFRLASMSKPITGVAVMMLVEEGKIRLNDPVSRFIPEFANLNKVAVPRPGASAAPQGRQGGAAAAPQYDVVSANRQITIADLLKHGSGLVSGGLGAADAARLAPRTPTDTLATYIPKLAAVPLDFQPGTLWRYSGSAGFDVLSRVVESPRVRPMTSSFRTGCSVHSVCPTPVSLRPRARRHESSRCPSRRPMDCARWRERIQPCTSQARAA